MRTKTLLILILALTSASLVRAQQRPEQTVTLAVENEPLKRILHAVEVQAGVKFLYTNQINKKHPVSLVITKAPLSDALHKLLTPLEISYQLMEDGFIILKKNKTFLTDEDSLKKEKEKDYIKQDSSQRTITGRVTEAGTTNGIPGANILVNGTSRGSVTDSEGYYTITTHIASTLVFSYVGYLSKIVNTGTQTHIQVSLTPDTRQLGEVVVTALGLEREKRMLGYAMQIVPGGDISKFNESNLVSTLAGKAAGVTVLNNPSGIGGSSRIIIRGERSLNINKNQPLFVVDGVPVTNELIGSSGRNNQEADYGNGAGLINTDDVESITVLKGANATALYGSRGQNGVVLIKSKTGKGNEGISVSLNSTVTLENPLRLPSYQNVYGQGINGAFEFKEDLGSINWGPAMDGRLIKQFDSPTTLGMRGGDVGNLYAQIGKIDLPRQLIARGEIIPTPFIAHSNNVKDFFRTGVSTSQHISVSGNYTKGHIRASYTYFNQQGIIPNTGLKRHTFSLGTTYKLTPKLKIQLLSTYTKNRSNNRPSLSYGNENLMFYFIWMGRSVNTNSLRNYWQNGQTRINQFNSSYGAHDNPYFTVYENTNGQEVGRLYGNVSATYQFTDWLTLLLRAGTDYSDEFRTRKRAYSSQRFPVGGYREEKVALQETNADFLFSVHKNLSSHVTLSASLGGNAMFRQLHFSDKSVPQVTVPGVYDFANASVPPEYGTYRSKKKINSLYAFTQVGYKDYLFLELTGRNDWSSALPPGNWSYFYPSLSLSAIASDIFKLPATTISFAKLRAGIAGVGNDTDPHQLAPIYNVQPPVQGSSTYSEIALIPHVNLKPEQSRSIETGLEIRLFQDRLAMDVSLYHTHSKNQILHAQVSNTTGYRNRIINAGLIENKGLEGIFSVVPLKLSNGFKWTSGVNFFINRSKVKELYTDPVTGQKIESHVINSRYINIQASVGDRMGDMYGIGYQRVSADPSSPYYDPTGKYTGQIVYNDKGAPLATPNTIKLGNYNPDWLAGWYNTVEWKNISLHVLLEVRKGGKIYSHTQNIGREAGSLIETLEGRANGYDMSIPGNGVVGEGVVALKDAEGKTVGFTPNTMKLPAQEWHIAVTGNRRILEPSMYDASFVKLRELQLSYNFPEHVLKSKLIHKVTLSLVGRNLFVWTKVPHVDPETASTAGGTIIPGIDSLAIPSVRSYGLNISVKL